MQERLGTISKEIWWATGPDRLTLEMPAASRAGGTMHARRPASECRRRGGVARSPLGPRKALARIRASVHVKLLAGFS